MRENFNKLFTGSRFTIREPRAGKHARPEMEAYAHNQLIVVNSVTGKIVACIGRDQFYDKDGNRFTYD